MNTPPNGCVRNQDVEVMIQQVAQRCVEADYVLVAQCMLCALGCIEDGYPDLAQRLSAEVGQIADEGMRRTQARN
ncbi:MAG: hypothetical protein HC828_05995 [Blastochloris sp.]|nr:hypothetical protein [Blastochloris sp.]